MEIPKTPSPPKLKPISASKSKTGITVGSEQYDFCHHCKQLKNVQLLVSCKYQGCGMTKGYVPYPYEPQCYTINNVRIYNSDLGNRA